MELTDPKDYFEEEVIHIPITDVLDLHPFSPKDVVPAVEEYLSAARALGLVHLRIVHGKGIGWQRGKVREVLARTDFVVEFGDAPMEAGGWGATLVTLAPLPEAGAEV